MCTERLGRMRDYLLSLGGNIMNLDLNKFLVIDRFKWENTEIDLGILLKAVENLDYQGYHDYLGSFLTTDLQRRNLNLVSPPSFKTLRDFYEGK